ncbi:tRNA/rRNA methyltransferase SpoU [Nitzschia inconspicua]|uniref:tRNA/rRNA methyltransferase SpoU n=1 Tax=Nitzschia inconspicua TaxID=303405 RepID=A0A9K3LHK2_9STRA|nr:tRNA/rRNA methyltransferase SpoU [Nitzschia inconspicua]
MIPIPTTLAFSIAGMVRPCTYNNHNVFWSCRRRRPWRNRFSTRSSVTVTTSSHSFLQLLQLHCHKESNTQHYSTKTTHDIDSTPINPTNTSSDSSFHIDGATSQGKRDQRDDDSLPPPNDRAILLNQKLDALRPTPNNGFSTQFMNAALAPIQDPTCGYDDRFGRPALRTWKAFVFPKSENNNSSNNNVIPRDNNNDRLDKDQSKNVQLDAAAWRCARQIEFLIKRHQSHETEWIRHHDATSPFQDNNSNEHNDVIETIQRRFPIILILDNLRSALNVGSLFRTAETCACQAVYTCGITPHPQGSGSEKIRKSALGSERLVPTRHFATTKEAILHLRNSHPDMTIIAMETTERSKLYNQINFTRYYYRNPNEPLGEGRNDTDYLERDGGTSHGVALILGNEVTGVDAELLLFHGEEEATVTVIDEIIQLPTFGQKNSLNVAVCAPVVIFEILRQWKV